MFVVSTRDPSLRATFATAAESNAPGDGGLYLPHFGVGGGAPKGGGGRVPNSAVGLSPFDDIDELLALPFRPRSTEILFRLLAPELSRSEVGAMVDAALDFPVVHREVGPGLSTLELFHGPSLSFKDFGVRFLAQVLAWLRRREQAASPGARIPPRIVLTATSGDTGAAVVHAFHGLAGFGAAVLFPAGRISPLQERQIATLGGNVRAFAVDGSFDDCQRMVQSSFAHAANAALAAPGAPNGGIRLVSANSIHLARLLAQVTYYFEAAARAPRGRPLVVAVPSGNFGNLCAGVLAQRLGAPIAALVAATNANRTVPDFLDGQEYRARASTATLSNAMDVGAPNNWQRVEFLFEGDAAAMRRALRWGSADDAATRDALATLERRGYRADPHAAVAFAVLRRTLRSGEHGLFLATAHPAKFEVSRDPAEALPAALAAAATRPLLAEPIAADPVALRAPLFELADRLRF